MIYWINFPQFITSFPEFIKIESSEMKFGYNLFIIASLFGFICTAPNPTATYANKQILVEPDSYILYWNYNATDITFELHAKSSGWAGFGISPNGGMQNSDIIIFWVNPDGTTNFTERNTNGGKVKPSISTTQKWFPLLTKSQDGYLISKSTRKIKLCDTTGQHLDIEVGTPSIIFAWGSNLANGDISYHGFNRSTKSLPLISSLNTVVNLNTNQFETTDFRVNVIMKTILLFDFSKF